MHEGLAGFPIESQPFVTMARHVGGGVREVLEQTAIDQIIPLVDGEAQALQSLRG